MWHPKTNQKTHHTSRCHRLEARLWLWRLLLHNCHKTPWLLRRDYDGLWIMMNFGFLFFHVFHTFLQPTWMQLRLRCMDWCKNMAGSPPRSRWRCIPPSIFGRIFKAIHSKPPTWQIYINLANITAFPNSSTTLPGSTSHHHHPSVFCLNVVAFDTGLRPNSLMLCHFTSRFPHHDLISPWGAREELVLKARSRRTSTFHEGSWVLPDLQGPTKVNLWLRQLRHIKLSCLLDLLELLYKCSSVKWENNRK